MPNKPRVAVFVLTGTERANWINPELSMMLFNMARDPRFHVEYATIKDARPFEVARNLTIKLARDGRFDWMVSIDNDNFLPNGATPLDIIAQAKSEHSVIGMTYAGPAGDQLRLLPNETGGKVDGLFQEVSAVGGGVLMVHRRVWEKIPHGPWFKWMFGEDQETLDQSKGGVGEDVYFSRLARERSFKVWTHRNLLAGHYKTFDATRIVMSQMSRVQSPPVKKAEEKPVATPRERVFSGDELLEALG